MTAQDGPSPAEAVLSPMEAEQLLGYRALLGKLATVTSYQESALPAYQDRWAAIQAQTQSELSGFVEEAGELRSLFLGLAALEGAATPESVAERKQQFDLLKSFETDQQWLAEEEIRLSQLERTALLGQELGDEARGYVRRFAPNLLSETTPAAQLAFDKTGIYIGDSRVPWDDAHNFRGRRSWSREEVKVRCYHLVRLLIDQSGEYKHGAVPLTKLVALVREDPALVDVFVPDRETLGHTLDSYDSPKVRTRIEAAIRKVNDLFRAHEQPPLLILSEDDPHGTLISYKVNPIFQRAISDAPPELPGQQEVARLVAQDENLQRDVQAAATLVSHTLPMATSEHAEAELFRSSEAFNRHHLLIVRKALPELRAEIDSGTLSPSTAFMIELAGRQPRLLSSKRAQRTLQELGRAWQVFVSDKEA